MVDFPITFIITLEDQLSAAVNSTKSSVAGLGESFNDVKTETENMSTALGNAESSTRDAASASDEATQQVNELGDAENTTSEKTQSLGSRLKETAGSAKDLVTGFAGIATGAMNLYNSYDSVNEAQISLDSSNLKVERSQQSLTDAQQKAGKAADDVKIAQDNLNTAIAKYGENTPQAEDAAKKLKTAQDELKDSLNNVDIKTQAVELATERADQAQENFNKTVLNAAITVVPSLITIGDKCVGMYNKWTESAGSASTSTGKLTTSTTEQTVATDKSASSSSNMGGVLGALGAAAAAVTVQVGLQNSVMDEADKKGANLTQTERIFGDVMAGLFSQGIPNFVVGGLGSMINGGKQTQETIDGLAKSLLTSGKNAEECTRLMIQMGLSKDTIDAIKAKMDDLNNSTNNVANSATNTAAQLNIVLTQLIATGASAATAGLAAQQIVDSNSNLANSTNPNQAELTKLYNQEIVFKSAVQSGQVTKAQIQAGLDATNRQITSLGGTPQYMAEGGTAKDNMWAMVGEEGPELLRMNRGDSVIPLDYAQGAASFAKQAPVFNVTVHPFIHIGNVHSEIDLKRVKDVIVEEVNSAIGELAQSEAY